MNRRSYLLILGLALAVATCRDGLGPSERLSGQIAVSPILPSDAEMADFGLTLDAVRFIVVRPLADTLADTTVALPPEVTELALDLRVPLLVNPESLIVSVQALSGALPLFEGSQRVQVPDSVVPDIPVSTYIGPVADSIVIQPRDPFLLAGDSLRFQVLGFNGGVPVTQFYIAWTSDDSATAPINHFGVLRAPGTRGATWIRARTPSGAVDSVRARFTPPATQLVPIAGGSQTDTVGTVLATPLEVEARAADGLGVGGVAVRFRTLTGGGTVADTLAVTDSLGRARTAATLGGTIGLQSFEASAAGLSGSPVVFGATALAGQPTQLTATAGDAQLAVVGTAVLTRPSVRVRDVGGNPVAGVAVTFTVTAGGGGIAGATQTTDAAGVATAGDWTLGTAAGPNTLRASAAGLTRTFTATGVAGAVTQIIATAGDLQSVLVGLAVPVDPAVRAQDQYGNPVAGASVTFAVAGGGGSATGATQLTNAAGIATLGSWTVGTLAGTNQLTATLAGVTPVTFSATGLAGAAASIVKVAGDGQSGIVNALVGIAPSVRLEDPFGNPVIGASVTFGVTGGGGSLLGATQTTDSAGIATLGGWRLGTSVGANTLAVTSGSLSTDFVADALVGIPAKINAFLGDGQSGIVSTLLTIIPTVVVLDSFNNTVPGVPVAFTPSTGGIVSAPLDTTDADGVADVGGWTLATLAGTNTLTATSASLSVGFTATGLAGAATQLVKASVDSLTSVVGQLLGAAPAVRALDQFGNLVSGAPVAFLVTSGGGSVTGATPITNAAGLATLGSWTLGTLAGENEIWAVLPADTVVFTATGIPDVPALLEQVSGDGQVAVVNTVLLQAPVVRLVDQYGNPIAGVPVLFDIQVDGGALGDTLPLTDASGFATPGSWTIADFVTTNLLQATSAGVPAVQFSAVGIPDVPTQLLRASDSAQTAIAGQAVSVPPAVEVRDQYFNPVPGVAVTFTPVVGAGSVSPSSVTTDAAGVARVTTWTLDAIVGLNALEAAVPGLANSPMTFSATGITTTADTLFLLAGDAQSGVVANALGVPYQVQVFDAGGAPVQAVQVHWAVDSLGGVMSPTSSLTDVNGVATSTRFLGPRTGPQTATATVGGLAGSPVVFAGTATPDVPFQMLKRSPDPQTGIVASFVTAPVVEVVDQYDNPVPGIPVTFALAGLGALGTTLDTTDAAGRASTGSWLLGDLIGVSTVTATATGIADVVFTATSIAGLATQVLELDGNGQSGTAGEVLPLPYRVRVTDLFGNPVKNITVNWEIDARAGGGIAPATVPTDSLGIAAAFHTLGSTIGPHTALAWVSGLADTVTFTSTATAGAAAAILKDGGDAQSAVVNTAVAIAPTVKVTDGSGAPVAGHSVTWALASGGGSLGTPATVQTDAAGIATAPVWTLGTAAGGNGLTATSAGLTGSPVSFTATGTAGPAAQMAIKAGNGQSATVGTAVPIKPAVTVKDQFNNPVSGVQVTFTPLLGGSTVTGSPATTSTAGDATLLEWKLGTTSGTNTLRAAVSGVTPVTFVATALAGAPVAIEFLTPPSAALAGDTIAPPVQVVFRDGFSNISPVNDLVSVGIGVSPVQDAQLSGAVQVQASSGIAEFPDLSIDSAGTGFTLAALTAKVSAIESDPFDVGGVVGMTLAEGLNPIDAEWDPVSKWLFLLGGGPQAMLGLFDPADGRVTSLPLNHEGTGFAMAIDPQRSQLYVTNGTALLVIDTRSPDQIATLVDFQRPARGVDVDIETGYIFVAVDEDQEKGAPPALYVLDGTLVREQPDTIGIIPFNEATSPAGVVYSRFDNRVYVAMPRLGVGAFDISKQEHVGTIQIIGDKDSAGTYGVAVDLRRSLVYATNRADSSVSIIDPFGLAEKFRVRVGELPEAVTWDEARDAVYVANSGRNTVSFIREDPKEPGIFSVVATLVVGPTPKAIAIETDGANFFVPTFEDSAVRVVRP